MDQVGIESDEIDEDGWIRGPEERGFNLISKAEEASAAGDTVRAEELYREAVAFERSKEIDLGYALSRYANFLFGQERIDEAAAILEESMDLGTDIPYTWGLYLTILARRRDITAMLEVYDRLPSNVVGDRGMAGALLGYASAGPSSNEAELDFAEQLSATVRDRSAECGDLAGSLIAAGVHGVVLERMGRVDEAIIEWQEAFAAGSTDAKTADRAALYQALGLSVRYRRVGSTEEVKLTSTLQSVDLEQVGEKTSSEYSQVPGLQGVDLERVGGPSSALTDWRIQPWLGTREDQSRAAEGRSKGKP